MERGQVLTGARARLYWNGAPVLYCTSVDYSEEYQEDPVEVLGELDVQEHVTTAYRVTMSAELVEIVGNELKSRNGQVIMSKLDEVLFSGEATAMIEDKKTGTVIDSIQGVKCTRQQKRIMSRGMVLTSVTFVARRIRSTSELTG